MKRLFAHLLMSALIFLCVPERAEARIAPHRALYAMSLDGVRSGSDITDAEGTMAFEWADACDGWAIQQRMALHFTHAEGATVPIESSVMMWESKDGAKYAFTVRKTLGGKDDGFFQGNAEMKGNGGAATYVLPKDKEPVDLPAGSVFPTGHTELIVRNALAGENFFTRRVFDGSDTIGFADVSAFIGPEVQNVGQEEGALPKDVASNPLLKTRAWPVRMAFFDPEEPSGVPDYEMDIILQENGVARSIRIDYGDFSVKGVLTKIDSSVSPLCPKS